MKSINFEDLIGTIIKAEEDCPGSNNPNLVLTYEDGRVITVSSAWTDNGVCVNLDKDKE